MRPDYLLYTMAVATLMKEAGMALPGSGPFQVPPVPGLPVPPGAQPPPAGGGAPGQPKLPGVKIEATGDAVQHLPGILRGGLSGSGPSATPGAMAAPPPAAPAAVPEPPPQQPPMQTAQLSPVSGVR